MVTFTTDPRAAYLQARGQAGFKRASTPYQPPPNPYHGASSVWGNLDRLAHYLSSKWDQDEAVRLQKAQQGAQRQVLASILEAGGATPPPGGNYFEQFATDVPLAGVSPAPGARETQLRRKEIGDDGRADFSPVSAEIAETAGIDPLQLKLLYDKARLEGNVATEKAIEREAQRGMERAIADKNWPLVEQWGNILDPTEGLKRELAEQKLLEGRTYSEEQLSKQRAYDEEKADRNEVQRWTVDGKKVWVQKGAYRRDQELSLDQRQFTAEEPENMVRVSLVNPVRGRTQVWVTKQERREDAALPVKDQRFKPAPGVRLNEEGRFVSDEDDADKYNVIGMGTIKELADNLPEGAPTLLLEYASAGDIGGMFDRTITATWGWFGGRPPYSSAEKTQREGAELNTLSTLLMASMARMIAPRVPVWSQKIAAKLMPGRNLSNSENAERIRALIPRLQLKYNKIHEALANNKVAKKDLASAYDTLKELENNLPILAHALFEYERGGRAVKGTIWEDDDEVGGERFICEQEFCKKENGAPGWRRLTNG